MLHFLFVTLEDVPIQTVDLTELDNEEVNFVSHVRLERANRQFKQLRRLTIHIDASNQCHCLVGSELISLTQSIPRTHFWRSMTLSPCAQATNPCSIRLAKSFRWI
jgi:hypothetical protein